MSKVIIAHYLDLGHLRLGSRVPGAGSRLDSMDLVGMYWPVNIFFLAMHLDSVAQFLN